MTWTDYNPQRPDSPMPIRATRWQEYRVGSVVTRSMVTPLELAYLYGVARDRWTGAGNIIELGPMLGVTTVALASGLAANTNAAPKQKRIFSYDLFLDHGLSFVTGLVNKHRTGSFFDTYLDIVCPHLDFVVPVPGDLLALRYDDGPIEVLFIDAAKSWALNDHIVRTMFPHLLVGATVIFQDYFYFGDWPNIVTPEHFIDHFEFVCAVTPSAVFRCTKPFSAAESVEVLGATEHERLLFRAIERNHPASRPVLQAALAKFYADNDLMRKAIQTIQAIDLLQLSDDPLLDSSSHARAGVNFIRSLVRPARLA